MPTAEKERTIEQAKEWYSKAAGVVFTDYKGLKVRELQELRANVRAKGGELHILKNTLFRIAAGEDTAKLPPEVHNGTTAFAFVFENEAQVAKALLDYAKSSKRLVVKGGFFGGKAFTPKEVEVLSELPPKDVLISQIIGLIASPISNLVGVIEALYADPIRTIGAVADKAAEGSPAPEPATTVASDATVAPAEASEASAVAPEANVETAEVASAEPSEAAAEPTSTEAAASPETAEPAETIEPTETTENP